MLKFQSKKLWGRHIVFRCGTALHNNPEYFSSQLKSLQKQYSIKLNL